LKLKVLLILTLTILIVTSTITVIAINLDAPAISTCITKFGALTSCFRLIQPTGDPIDNPVAPSN